MKSKRRQVEIPSAGAVLPGELRVPQEVVGLVIFVHGSGSSGRSPRNHFVAQKLEASGFGTLLFDLLTASEGDDFIRQFDIDLLTNRLVEAILWLGSQPEVDELPINLLGSGTGAAAALKATARLGRRIRSVVCRGGRPDFAFGELQNVTAPSLFIVGGNDADVLHSNRHAMHSILPPTVKHIEIIPGASHLFEERGALEKVAGLAGRWFAVHGSRGATGPGNGKSQKDSSDSTFMY